MYYTLPAKRYILGGDSVISVVLTKPKSNNKEKVKEEKIYDVIIIEGGVAGLTAEIYLARTRMDTLLIEKNES